MSQDYKSDHYERILMIETWIDNLDPRSALQGVWQFFRRDLLAWVLCLSLLFHFCWDPNWQRLWVERWGIVIGIFVSAALYRTKLPFFVKTFLIYYVLAVLASAFFGGFHTAPDSLLIPLLREASLGHIAILGAFLAFLWIRLDLSRPLFYSGLILTAGIVFRTGMARWDVPFLQNPSMAATFVVLATAAHPVAWIGIAFTRSWTAVIAMLSALIFKHRKIFFGKLLQLAMPLPLALMLIGVGLLWQKHGIPDNGRFHYWTQTLQWFSDLPWYRWVFGIGPGTGRVWFPYLGFLHPNAADVADVTFWAHNDWLQAFCELGIAGSVFGILALAQIWARADEEQRMLGVAFGVAMCTNMPVHWALPAMVGWNLIGTIIHKKGSV